MIHTNPPESKGRGRNGSLSGLRGGGAVRHQAGMSEEFFDVVDANDVVIGRLLDRVWKRADGTHIFGAQVQLNPADVELVRAHFGDNLSLLAIRSLLIHSTEDRVIHREPKIIRAGLTEICRGRRLVGGGKGYRTWPIQLGPSENRNSRIQGETVIVEGGNQLGGRRQGDGFQRRTRLS